jgi:hypothetical protein
MEPNLVVWDYFSYFMLLEELTHFMILNPILQPRTVLLPGKDSVEEASRLAQR